MTCQEWDSLTVAARAKAVRSTDSWSFQDRRWDGLVNDMASRTFAELTEIQRELVEKEIL